MSDFDYGTGVEEGVEVVGGGKVKNEVKAAEGMHEARIRSIVHLGVSESFDYTTKASKGFFPKAVVVFELKEEGDLETDGETPLVFAKDFEIKKGEKANLTLLLNTFTKDDGTSAKNFEELIGCSGNVELVHKGEYVNQVAWNKGGVSAINPKYKKGVAPLVTGLGVGNVKFSDMTVAALEELHAWNHVADLLMQSTCYEGSTAQWCVEAIRAQEGREDYAKKDAKKGTKKASTESKAPASDLDEEQEY